MPPVELHFEKSADFDPQGDFEAFLRSVPAKWVVYLMADDRGQPVQLLCVKNLRASLRRRLGTDAAADTPMLAVATLSKRVNYREFIRRIHWCRVDSAFEADVVYLDVAREVFPATYQGMTGLRPSWFVHVDPDQPFPRYVKTAQPAHKVGLLFGPLEDKHAAAALVELMEDAFDLCRYHNLLVLAPHASACAYKEMGRCAAPCDGTIPMEQYRADVTRSAAALADPATATNDLMLAMRSAATALQFEQAGKLKGLIEKLAKLRKGPYRHLRRLDELALLSLQRGPRPGTAKVFLITPDGVIEQIAGLINPPAQDAEPLFRHALAILESRRHLPLDPPGIERLGVLTHHLFQSRQTHGAFLGPQSWDESLLTKSYKALQKQPLAPETDTEGVTRELQAM